MPVNDHLTWTEVTNFAPGLWTDSLQEMPASAAQQMDNCYPYPGGGLRAFYASSPNLLVNTGITAGKAGRGFIINMAEDSTAPPTDRLDAIYTVIVGSPTNSPPALQLYDMRVYKGETTWTNRQNFTDGSFNLSWQCQFVVDTVPVVPTVGFTIQPGGNAAQSGVWYQTAGSAPSQALGATAGYLTLVAHQNRFVSSFSATVLFTAPGSESFVGAGTILPVPNAPGNGIAWLAPISPSDLLGGTVGGHVFNIQGDLADPTVRILGRLQAGSFMQAPIFTPRGLVVLSNNDGAYFMDGSGNTTRFTSQIDQATFKPSAIDSISSGQPAFVKDFLFLPRGIVYDDVTQAFFRLPDLANCMLYDSDRTWRLSQTNAPRLIGVTDTANVTFPGVTFGSARATDFTWKSAPLHDPSGRQVEMREVQLIVRSYEASAQLTVTVNGTARTVTLGAAGRYNPRFLFAEIATQLDVTVRSVGGAGSTEAPSVESVRVGSRSRHLIA
jgi:hypothetical protein